MRREETKRAKAKKNGNLTVWLLKEHFFLFFWFLYPLETLQMNDKGYISMKYIEDA